MEFRHHNTDITLINVPYQSEGGQVMKPLGLCYLASFLVSKGFSVVGLDFSYSKLSPGQLVDKFKLYDFPIVGLSFYNINAAVAYQIAQEIKSINPSVIIVAGGPHVSALYDTLFKSHPEMDIVVKNEGELTTEELIVAIKEKSDLREVKGISYHIKGEIFVNEPRERISNLDQIPAPTFKFETDNEPEEHFFYDSISGELKLATALVTSRSCPYNCSFCAIILIGRQWRKCSPLKIVDDLTRVETVDAKRYNHIYFLDANFFVSVKRTVEVAKELRRYNPKITFSFSTRANQLIKGKEYIRELADLGLRAVEVGIESGSDKALIRYAKDTTVEQNYEAIRLLQDNGIQLFLDFIMFDAETDIDDLEKNIIFLENSNLDTYVPWSHLFSYMTPYLGTGIRKRYESILDRKFDEDYLPTPESLFLNHQVKQIFMELNKFKPTIRYLKDILNLFESNIQTEKFTYELARLKLNYLEIRRIPFVIFKKLIFQAKNGDEINIETVLPVFYTNTGKKIPLKEFLTLFKKEIIKFNNQYELA